jgi:predicted nucleic acid-binding protein
MNQSFLDSNVILYLLSADVVKAVKSACKVIPLTIATHETAVKIAQRYDISFYDANICAAAILSGAKILVSEDMQDGMSIDGIVIQNPFR